MARRSVGDGNRLNKYCILGIRSVERDAKAKGTRWNKERGMEWRVGGFNFNQNTPEIFKKVKQIRRTFIEELYSFCVFEGSHRVSGSPFDSASTSRCRGCLFSRMYVFWFIIGNLLGDLSKLNFSINT